MRLYKAMYFVDELIGVLRYVNTKLVSLHQTELNMVVERIANDKQITHYSYMIDNESWHVTNNNDYGYTPRADTQ